MDRATDIPGHDAGSRDAASISLILALLAISCTSSMLTACNTPAGAGQDIPAIGYAITDTAQDTKDKM